MTLRRILFVDDDHNVLQGLQRMLRGKRDEWTMNFVSSGAKALEVMEKEPFDAIISDMRMPGMDGAELLTEVQRRYPAMVRVILSGYSEEESVLRTVGPAHQFLAKPCSAQTLVDVLHRAIELRRVLDSENLRKLLAGLKSLPTPSATYFQLVKYIDLPQASANGVAEIIAGDVAMTAELLKLTNSAYFSIPARVTTPLQAVRILGFETLRALVLRIGIFRSFKGLAAMGRVMEDLNRDSFLMARIARRIARAEKFEPPRIEEAFCAGMLCSIGMLVLLDSMPVKLNKVQSLIAKGIDVLDAESQVLGGTHFQIGAYLLGLWGFNRAVVEAVAFCGQPSVAASQQLDVAGTVHIARVLAGPSPAYAARGESGAGQMQLDRAYVERLNLDARLAAWKEGAAAERKM
jgi:HD-like signal output (HDOD) protein